MNRYINEGILRLGSAKSDAAPKSERTEDSTYSEASIDSTLAEERRPPLDYRSDAEAELVSQEASARYPQCFKSDSAALVGVCDSRTVH